MSNNPFAQATAWQPPLQTQLPAGNFVVMIDEANDGTSSGGHPQIELIMSGPEGATRDWLVLAPNEFSINKAVGLFEAAGIGKPSEDDIAEGTRLKPAFIARLVGKIVGVVIRDEDDFKNPGQKRPRPQGYRDPSDIKAPGALPTSDVTSASDHAAFSSSTAASDLPF